MKRRFLTKLITASLLVLICKTSEALNSKNSHSKKVSAILNGAWEMVYDNEGGHLRVAKDEPLKIYVLCDGFWMWYGPDSAGKWNEGGAGTYEIAGNIWKQKSLYSFDRSRIGYNNWSKFEIRGDTLYMQNYIKMFYKDKDETADFPKRYVKWVRYKDSNHVTDSESLVMDSFNSDGTRINYFSKGKGEPIILIHGFLVNSNWNWIEPGIFDSLAKNYKVIAMDVRGFGKSEKPHSQDAYGKEILEDINRLMKHLNIDRANIIGYSMGGSITLAYLASYPEKVIKAVAGGCGWIRDGDDTHRDFKKFRDLLATKPAGVSITEQLGFRFDSTSELSQIVNADDPLAVSGVANGLLELFNIAENKLKTNKVPTLLLIGEKDDVKSAEIAAAVAPNMKLQILKGQDHLSAINDPLFPAAIQSFLTEK